MFMSYANNKGTDQPAYLRSLISAFVVCCLDSIIPPVFISEMSSICLASVAEQDGLSQLVAESEDRFPRDEAHASNSDECYCHLKRQKSSFPQN